MNLYWAALSFGLLGSLHCAGMCGPIAFALPLDRSNAFRKYGGLISYNTGRMITYTSLGLIFGTFGWAAFLAGFQRYISIAVGIIMIGSVAMSYFGLRTGVDGVFTRWLGQLKAQMGKRFKRTSIQNLTVIGLLNGLLPCGLVYMAVVGSASVASPGEGAVFMLLFGLGTWPMMIGLGTLGFGVKSWVIQRFRRWVPVLIVILGILFILRGSNLGIPYISPKIVPDKEVVDCH